MNGATAPILAAIVIQLGLGLAVFMANPRRKSNQCFLLVSFTAIGWLAALLGAFTTKDGAIAANFIRGASVAAVLILAALNLLRLSIRLRQETWSRILRRSGGLLVLVLGIAVLAQTDFFLHSARIPEQPGSTSLVPIPIYGPGIYVYAALFFAAVIALIVGSWRDLRQTTGSEHAELAFLIVSALTILVGTVVFSFALAFFVPESKVESRATWIAPLRIIFFSLVVAYAIASRKIMEVGLFLRRAIGYVVLTGYLLALYALVWWLVSTVFQPFLAGGSKPVAHVLAAIVIAFAMAPARGISQRFANRLFIGSRRIDFQSTMNAAAGILKSVTTLQDLLDRFAKTIGEAIGTDRVFILLSEKGGYVQQYPAVHPETGGEQLRLSRNDPAISYLQTNQEPLVLDELHRMRQTPELEEVARQMDRMKTAVALGFFSRQHLAGVMLLGPRLSGRIYSAVEQNALQVLCGQLAVAIDNAQLFTEVEHARIYNETLLENLTTGVIAAGADERVTVFNNEAGQITGLNPREIIDHSLDRLPGRLREILCETLRTGKRQEDSELVLPAGDHNAVLRASSSIFHGQAGEMLGALVVLTDITALKRLELQIRRSDRLASLGTLSAGMAHEIKNPLVSIKTFAQLLPERYQDSDFRDTFSNLIGHEIDRIDSLVNQLLRFARPAKPVLAPMHVHEVLEKSLQLVGHRLYQKEIKLTRSWEADVDTIRADADQLEQVFLNFFLNAMDAMKRGGELHVTTEIHAATEWVTAISGTNGDSHEILRVSVRDDGEGIRKEDIAHVFDPFFTTKDYGTGLGLSVVHGIIQEHGGQIEVESELKKGTAFHILLPLVRFAQGVAAA
jgi:nitrogen-specific signal transduction histidine kinase